MPRLPGAVGVPSTTVTVVVGAQFGDEAKGKITDYLARDARYVVRTNGGPNTGHTIHLAEGTVVLHQLACGVLRPGVVGVSGPGMVVNPQQFEAELADLRNRGLLKGEVIVSERAHAILPIHIAEEGWEESLRESLDPSLKLDTTRKGIGPAYASRYARLGIRLAEIVRPALLKTRLDLLYAAKYYLKDLPPRDALEEELRGLGERLRPLIRATEPILWDAISRGENILLEGAQSALLDIDYGTYPYVSSSHPTSAGALVGSGIAPQELDRIIGVTKAYATRVGMGPFPTEVTGDMGAYLQREGHERGATTGRPRRVGWLDLVLLRYVSRLNGFTSLALTKVDVLGGLDEVPVCDRYVLPNGETVTDYPPSVPDELEHVQPVYERFPGWPPIGDRVKERIAREGVHALPGPLRRFIDHLARETRVPVEFVGYGPRREETLTIGPGTSGHVAQGMSAWSG